MDRNYITGLILIVAIVFAWTVFFAPDQEEKSKDNKDKISTKEDKKNKKSKDKKIKDTVNLNDTLKVASDDTSKTDSIVVTKKPANGKKNYGIFSNLTAGKSETIKVKTDVFKGQISTKGGFFEDLFLSQHKTFEQKPLPLFKKNEKNAFSVQFAHNNKIIDTKDLFFTSKLKSLTVKGEKKKSIALTAKIAANKFIEQKFTFTGNSYEIQYSIRFVGLEDDILNNHVDLNWVMNVPRTEKNLENMRSNTTVYYNYSGDIEDLDANDSDPQKELVQGNVDWVSMKSQFFVATLIPDVPFVLSTFNSEYDEKNDSVTKTLAANMQMRFNHQKEDVFKFKVYAGPLAYKSLKAYDNDMEKQLPLGWSFTRFVNTLIVIPTFNFLQNHIASYGIIIALLALLIKLLLMPLTYKSYVSMAKMRVINQRPEIKALEEKFKENPTKLQTEKMVMYKKAGVNVLGGCLPMVLQFPVLIAMFYFFPSSIELRQQSFLWATDLSTYDSIASLPFNIPFYGDHVSLFTLLMTISTLIYTYMNQKAQGTTTGQMAQMKYVSYFMPIVFLGVLNNYAAGLSYYYLVANLITIAQTTIIKATINEQKLVDKMKMKEKKYDGKKLQKTRMQKWLDSQEKKQKQYKNQQNKKRK